MTVVNIAVYARIGTGYNFSVNKKMLCYCSAALSLKCDWISESSMRPSRLSEDSMHMQELLQGKHFSETLA